MIEIIHVQLCMVPNNTKPVVINSEDWEQNWLAQITRSSGINGYIHVDTT